MNKLVSFLIVILFNISCKRAEVNPNCAMDDLEKELTTFINYTKEINTSKEFVKGNVFNVVNYRYRSNKKSYYSITNDEIYRNDSINIIDEYFNTKGEFPKKALKGFVVIDDNLVCFYGDIDFPKMKPLTQINTKKYKYLKGNEITDNYQTFSATFKEEQCEFELKKVYMHKIDSIGYLNFRKNI